MVDENYRYTCKQCGAKLKFVHDCYVHLLSHDTSAKKYRTSFDEHIHDFFKVNLTQAEVQERLKEVIQRSLEARRQKEETRRNKSEEQTKNTGTSDRVVKSLAKNKKQGSRLKETIVTAKDLRRLEEEEKERRSKPIQLSKASVRKASNTTSSDSERQPISSKPIKFEFLPNGQIRPAHSSTAGSFTAATSVGKTSQPNRCADRALEIVKEGRTIFITGKAGTGKTTLLKRITRELRGKKIVVVAPTGVAAKNAEGVTIHSFLRLPITPYIPGMRVQGLFALKSVEIEVVKQIDIMIIDEVSMVRCDLLDMVDAVLRHYRKSSEPFGGVQVVMFGDLHQLMPVVKSDDWDELRQSYKTPYFYSSKVLEGIGCPMYELTKVFRQSDSDFIKLLNHVRKGKITPYELQKLRGRYIESFNPNDDEGYIRLTTHNRLARLHNKNRLDELLSPIYTYKAYIEGYVPSEEYPNEYNLKLKEGARVMFIRNDNSANLYVNGTLGTIVETSLKNVSVHIDNGPTINVGQESWEYYRYHINKRTEEIERELVGVFHQIPLKLAWAVTIHKSQGLTFDKVVIDAGRAFTYGQVYVALSRCRKFHGIVLVSPITEKIIKTDPEVIRYMQSTERLNDEDEIEGFEETDDMQVDIPASITGVAADIFWMVRDGLTYSEILEQSTERVEVIQAGLAKLILEGLVDIHKFMDSSKFRIISDAIGKVGLDANIKDIRAACIGCVLFNEISMVINHYKNKSKQESKHTCY